MSTINATTLRATTIQHTNGTNALTIDSTGRVNCPTLPSFRVSRADNIAQPAGVVTGFTNVFHNVGGHFNTSTNRFTAPIAGVYFFSATGGMSSGGTTGWGFDIRRNAGIICRVELAGASFGFTWKTGSVVVNMAVNDYIDLNIFVGTCRFDPTFGNFCGFLIG
jgi:hypothetical protein